MNDDYNVYNNFDSNFINYGELYKTPNEMKMNSKSLIGDYADALIKGPSDVYVDSPNLVGNRYFIDTNTQCKNKDNNNKLETRSILVDNVMDEALNQTKGGNKGLIYSLLASLKMIDSDTMFTDMKNNEPTHFKKYSSTEYLRNSPNADMPLCSEVSVYSSDAKDAVISGWMTEEDIKNVDPNALAQKEGFVDMGSIVTQDLTPNQFQGQMNKLNAAMDEQANTVTEETQNKASSTLDNANNIMKQHNKKGSDFAVSAASDNMNRVKKNREVGKNRGNSARRSGQKQMLRMKTEEFLTTEKPTGGVGYSIIELLEQLINITYSCGENHDEVARIPAPCVEEIFSGDLPPNQPSQDAKRTNLCSGQSFGEISVKNFVNELKNTVKTNQTNTKKLSLPVLPAKQVCTRVEKPLTGLDALFSNKRTWENKYVDSYDYKIYEDKLETFRRNIAREIVRYRNVGVFGQCDAIANKNNSEGFTTQLMELPENKITFSFTDIFFNGYIIVLIFLIFFIVYKFLIRYLKLNKVSFYKLKK